MEVVIHAKERQACRLYNESDLWISRETIWLVKNIEVCYECSLLVAIANNSILRIMSYYAIYSDSAH